MEAVEHMARVQVEKTKEMRMNPLAL